MSKLFNSSIGSVSGAQKWINVFGDVELIEALTALETRQCRPALKKGIAKGCKMIAVEAKSLCPKDEGHLRQSIKSEVTRMLSGRVFVDPAAVWLADGSRVRFRGGKTKKEKQAGRGAFLRYARENGMRLIRPAMYAHLVELGHLGRKKEDGTRGKSVPAHPFMVPALQRKKEEAFRVIEHEVREAIAKDPKYSGLLKARREEELKYKAWESQMMAGVVK